MHIRMSACAKKTTKRSSIRKDDAELGAEGVVVGEEGEDYCAWIAGLASSLFTR